MYLRINSKALLLFLLPLGLLAQRYEPFFPGLEWKTIETDHFLVHYHGNNKRLAEHVAHISEKIYGPVTDLYQHTPDQKVSWIIRDHEDISNGAAYFYDNKIEISASALDFEFRGTHPWLWDVITHEFTHIIQIQTTMKLGRTFPAIYFQWLGYERERRPDVLYGYPNVLVSYPLSAFVVPPWFAEGTAQYNAKDVDYDYWDTHRDMILRMAVLEGKQLSWKEMSVFGKNSLGNESVYNVGYSFVSFIAEKYGPEMLTNISRRLSVVTTLTIDQALKEYGIDAETLYSEWLNDRIQRYTHQVKSVGTLLNEGQLIESDGFGNLYPSFSPDGNSIAYVSNKGTDYLGTSSLYLYRKDSGTSERLTGGVRSSISFSPDGTTLYYSKLTNRNRSGAKLYDLFSYDLASGEETRLTFGLRAHNPSLSSSGQTLVFVYASGGTLNLGMIDIDGANFRRITSFSNGEQVYTPAWGPEDNSIFFAFSNGFHRSLASVDTTGENFRPLLAGEYDARDPAYDSFTNSVIFSSDRSGIYNIHRYSLENGTIRQITNLIGGAFTPRINSYGEIVFASFAADGYKIRLIAQDSIQSGVTYFTKDTDFQILKREYSRPDDLSESLGYPSRDYMNTFTSLSVVPVLRIENYNKESKGIDLLKPGFYFMSSEVLDRFSIFGGANINRRLERDLFFIGEYKDRIPLLYDLGLEPILSLELFNITRSADATVEFGDVSTTTEITYNLLEFIARFRHRLFSDHTTFSTWYSLSRYNADIGSFVNPNTNQVQPSFRNVYLVANSFYTKLQHYGILPSASSAINPVGRTFTLQYSHERNQFNADGEFEIKSGLLVPVYKPVNIDRLEASFTEHLPLWNNHTLSLNAKGGSILGGNVDEFFNFYAGGFTGMRSYPFYALGGNEYASLVVEYRAPLIRKLDATLFHIQFQRLYGSLFIDYGAAWDGTAISAKEIRKGIGGELRLDSFSFYLYPTRIFLSAAYGLDTFNRNVMNTTVRYGNEWLFYLGVLFSFELSDVAPSFTSRIPAKVRR